MLLKMNVFVWICIFAVANALPQRKVNKDSDVKIQHRSGIAEIEEIPYYGGAKGQVLEVVKDSNGEVISEQIKQINTIESHSEPSIPTDQINIPTSTLNQFNTTLQKLYLIAANLIAMQMNAQKNGLNLEENLIYKQMLTELNEVAKNLVQIQENLSDKTPVQVALPLSYGVFLTPHAPDPFRGFLGPMKRSGESIQLASKNEEEIIEENTEDNGEHEEEEENNESVAVELPPEGSSVAEVKPIGIAVAGPGGVAVSKPVGTAVVGNGGLAIARPVATAISGVPPSQVGLPLGTLKQPAISEDKEENKKDKKKKKKEKKEKQDAEDDEDEDESNLSVDYNIRSHDFGSSVQKISLNGQHFLNIQNTGGSPQVRSIDTQSQIPLYVLHEQKYKPHQVLLPQK